MAKSHSSVCKKCSPNAVVVKEKDELLAKEIKLLGT